MKRFSRFLAILTGVGLGAYLIFVLFLLVFVGFVRGCEDSMPCIHSGSPGPPNVIVVGDTTALHAGSFRNSVCHPTENARYRWRSSNPNVFTVNQKGVVRATGVGEATLDLDEKNKEKQKERTGQTFDRRIRLRVVPPLDSVVLRPRRIRM